MLYICIYMYVYMCIYVYVSKDQNIISGISNQIPFK